MCCVFKLWPGFLFAILFGCKEHSQSIEDKFRWESLEVTATAYNALANQTDNNPRISSFGDSLDSQGKYIAVSRDLLKMGVGHNTPVKIEGLEGIYWVKDKMHYRWKKRIDIFMDIDLDSARAWGKQRVCISFGILIDSLENRHK